MLFKTSLKGFLFITALLLILPIKVFPQTIEVSVDWSGTPAGMIDQMIWGVNNEQIRSPEKTADAGFNEFLTILNPELIRIHHSNLSTEWTNSTTRSWEVEKIKAAFQNATGYGDAKIMMNIPRWPEWMGATNQPLAKEYEEEFIDLIAELVVMMKNEVKQEVDYWEIINEREGVYEKAGKLYDLWDLINRITERIRTIDPETKIGGPALTWANPTWINSFLDICGSNIDFITWHNYASGSPETTTENLLFQKLDQIESNAKFIIDELKMRNLGHLESFLSEYNVQWTWKPFEIRHTNNIGAVFQASLLKRIALTGVTGVSVWHLKGNAYGIIDGQNVQRATGSLYLLGNTYLYGTIATSTVSENTLEVLPVIMPNGNRSLLLMNKNDKTITVKDGGALLKSGSAESLNVFQIDDNGYLPQTFQVGAGDLRLPPYSVTLLTTAMADPKIHTVLGIDSLENGNSQGSTIPAKLYPNPARDHINISLWAETFEEASILISDIDASVISRNVYQLQNGPNTIGINVGQLKAGFYLLTIDKRSGRITKKLHVNR